MAAAMAVAFSPHRLLPFISVMVSVTALKAHPSQAKRKRVSLLRPNISVYSDVVEMHLCAHTEVTGSIDTCTIEYEGLSVEVEISTEDSNTIKVEKPGEDKDGSFRQEITYR
ncbi:hypothetical protein FOL46_003190 [Perkinsus olseni]|uniref:Uncharacterized protein n=1 Tax=Perkinsus olseni TaxID=32597 RepID=A0A7J6M3Z0_PEROL|nr:hypothetical protein FOL46_003190 [Perkinsus olseni]